MSEHPENYEDVTVYGLDDEVEAEMLDAQNECTFIWSNKEGWPVGVIMSYVGSTLRILAIPGIRVDRICILRCCATSASEWSRCLLHFWARTRTELLQRPETC